MSAALVLRNSLRAGYLPEMARKVWLRARYGSREAGAGEAWARQQSSDLDAWARAIDGDLWDQSLRFAVDMRRDAEPLIADLRAQGLDMGGGGCYQLLHFLVRLRRPQAVLETGVAAGWSTRALLSAIAENGSGRLYSSDFPYFRHPDPESLIGCLVPAELKGPWELYTKGDRRNLDVILGKGVRPELVHYDSDKSRGGREHFMTRVGPHLTPDAVVVMDDIQDDLFFRDLTRGREFRVFEFEGKYLGLMAGPDLLR